MNAGCAKEYIPTWRERVLARLYPYTPCPDIELTDDFKSYLTTEVRIQMDWKDRLRVLVSGAISVTTKTATNIAVERARSISRVNVMVPR